jgi:hypothetical protein
MNKRKVAKVVGWVLAALVSLELLYVVAAKVALKKLPELASYEALQLTYSDAGSWIPGRAWVRDFVVSGHDYNIQFEVRVKEAQIKLDLFALMSQHFHATEAITSGVSYYMRHNVTQLAGQEQRLAAFPKVRGYATPAVYPGPDPEPGPPDDAWRIEMENITAQVDDVWVVEYHYAGKGTAKGGFYLDPGRAFHLQPSEFVWEGGALSVGDVEVATEATGIVKTEMHLGDIQRIEGFNFVDDVKLDLDLSMRGGDISFLDVYSAMPFKRIKGAHSTDVRIVSEGRKILAGTSFKTTLEKLDLATDDLSVASDVAIQIGAKHDTEAGVIHLDPFSASLQNAIVGFGGERSKRFSATVVSSSARCLTESAAPALQATIDARVTPGDALLEAALGKTPAAITDAFLDLPRLVTRVALYLTKERSRVELLYLDAGDLKASGVWQDRPVGGTGEFSVKTSLVDVGVALDRNRVSWDLE